MTYLCFTSAHIPSDRIQSHGLTNHREAWETLSTMCPGNKGKGFGEPSLSLCPPRELNWDGGRKSYKLRWVYRAPLEKKKIFCTSLPVFTQVSFLVSVKRLENSFLWFSLAIHLLPVFFSPLWENEEKKRREIMFWIPHNLYEFNNTITNTNITLENNFYLLFENLIFSRFHLNSPIVFLLSPFDENYGAIHMYWGLFWWSWGPEDLKSQIRYEISSFPICLDTLSDDTNSPLEPFIWLVVHHHILDLDLGIPL